MQAVGRVATAEMRAAVAAAAARAPGYYAALGLPRGAPADDVRRAYRRAALALHPDKNTAPGAEEQFRRAASAFEVLGDEKRRRDYDLVVALCGEEIADGTGEDEDEGAGWDQEAFDAAPLKVKAMALGILVLVLLIRMVFWAVGWVCYAVMTVLGWLLYAVVVVAAVLWVISHYLYYGGRWVLSMAALNLLELIATLQSRVTTPSSPTSNRRSRRKKHRGR
jgi:curved DNA-binding protein CbpA